MFLRSTARALLGARRVGKTTLARSVFTAHSYLDLEDPRTAERFRQGPRFELDARVDDAPVLPR